MKVPKIPIRSMGVVFEKKGNPITEPKRKILRPVATSNADLIKARLAAAIGKEFGSFYENIDEDLGNPDKDRYLFAQKAPQRFEPGPDKPIRPKTDEVSHSRRRAAIMLKLNQRLRAASRRIDVKESKNVVKALENQAQQHFNRVDVASSSKKDS